MPKKKRHINSKAVFRIFWEHTKKYPWLFSFAILGVLIGQLGHVVEPYFIRNLFNLLSTVSPSPQNATLFLVPILLYAAVSFVSWFGGRVEMYTGYTLIAKATADLNKLAFTNLMRQSYQFFANSFAGALTRRVGRFSGAYENLFYSLNNVILEAVVYVLGVTAVLLSKNWILGSIVLTWVILFTFLQWWLARWQQPLRIDRAEQDTNLTSTLADAISNQNTVALFSANAYEEQRVGQAADQLKKAQLRSWNFNGIIYGVQGLLAIALNAGMLWVGVVLWQKGILTIGDLVLIQAYALGIFSNVWGLGRQFHTIYTSLADASEMVEILETPLEIKDIPGAQTLNVTQGTIAFDRVEFYFQKNSPVLSRFNLGIPGRQKVALVGPSGAGKSTITKLLLRLYDVPEGSISIDGQDISQVTQDSLRDAISFVPQEPILFHRTLMENIRYGRRDATDAEVLEAAKAAHCAEFIERLPLKYNTFVGERGIKLSGGERQRVAIARAILKDSPILVLDEATSSLDSESEMLIQDALATLMQNKTVLVIAHRLSTIMKMDRIIVLEGGTVVADGTHDELLKEGGLYHKLWSIQAGGFLIDEELAEK